MRIFISSKWRQDSTDGLLLHDKREEVKKNTSEKLGSKFRIKFFGEIIKSAFKKVYTRKFSKSEPKKDKNCQNVKTGSTRHKGTCVYYDGFIQNATNSKADVQNELSLFL